MYSFSGLVPPIQWLPRSLRKALLLAFVSRVMRMPWRQQQKPESSGLLVGLEEPLLLLLLEPREQDRAALTELEERPRLPQRRPCLQRPWSGPPGTYVAALFEVESREHTLRCL